MGEGLATRSGGAPSLGTQLLAWLVVGSNPTGTNSFTWREGGGAGRVFFGGGLDSMRVPNIIFGELLLNYFPG